MRARSAEAEVNLAGIFPMLNGLLLAIVVHSIGIPSRVTLGARGRGTAVERAGEVPQRSKYTILLHACHAR